MNCNVLNVSNKFKMYKHLKNAKYKITPLWHLHFHLHNVVCVNMISADHIKMFRLTI